MSDKIFFVAGTPRSGSTLLMNILGQNPAHYVTPTSGLVNMMSVVMNHWHGNQWFKAEGIKNVKPRIQNMLAGMLSNYFGEELDQGKVVFDKNREWPFYIRNLEEILNEPVKVIILIRDVRSIVASFEKLYQNRGIEYHYQFMNDDAWLATHTIEGRARMLLAPSGVIGSAINTTRDAIRIYKDHKPARLVRVSYEMLVHEPQQTLEKLHDALGLPKFEYDIEHVDQITHEDDMTFHGMDLHTIKPKIEARPRDWSCLTPQMIEELGKEFADINSLDMIPGEKPQESTEDVPSRTKTPRRANRTKKDKVA